MKKAIATVAICGLAALGAATPAHAEGPTCSNTETFGDRWNPEEARDSPAQGYHGQHVTGDYVMPSRGDGSGPAAPSYNPDARGAPSHPNSPAAPGASFCLLQAQSTGVHFP